MLDSGCAGEQNRYELWTLECLQTSQGGRMREEGRMREREGGREADGGGRMKKGGGMKIR